MFGGMGTVFFATLMYWFPKMFGKMYNERVAKIGTTLFIIGFNGLYFPFFILGYMGMPRRYYDFLPQYLTLHIISTVGSWILVTGILIMIGNLLYALLKGTKSPNNPWGGTTLEWRIPSPPPLENFDEIPVVTGGPYVHDRPTYIMKPSEEVQHHNGDSAAVKEVTH
jgi:cytochrome c oxidase subunit 1